jgi:hypothetical protein
VLEQVRVMHQHRGSMPGMQCEEWVSEGGMEVYCSSICVFSNNNGCASNTELWLCNGGVY